MWANTIINRTFTNTTGSYVALSAVSQPFSGEITCPSTNGAAVTFLGDDGASAVAWQPGSTHYFRSIDLSRLKAKTTSTDVVRIVGEFSG
jgi:hypothetical protein